MKKVILFVLWVLLAMGAYCSIGASLNLYDSFTPESTELFRDMIIKLENEGTIISNQSDLRALFIRAIFIGITMVSISGVAIFLLKKKQK